MSEKIELQEQPPVMVSNGEAAPPPMEAPEVPLLLMPTVKLRGKDISIDKVDLGGLFNNPLMNKSIVKKGQSAIDKAVAVETEKLQYLMDIAENVAYDVSEKEGEVINEDSLETILNEIAGQCQLDDLLAVKRLFVVSYTAYNKNGLSTRMKNLVGLSEKFELVEPFDPNDVIEDQTPQDGEVHHSTSN